MTNTPPNANPTPTTHGAWRMIDGQLVDESSLPPPAEAEPAPAAPSDLPAPPAGLPTPRRKAHPKPE